MNSPALRVRLDAGYKDQHLIRNLRFELAPGERLGLLGASGAGKSTLVLALLGLLPFRGGWARGEVAIAGEDLLARRGNSARRLRGSRIALVPQSSAAALNPALTVQKHFEHAWRAHRSDTQALKDRMVGLLERVALPTSETFLQRRADRISVGQAQRCTIALALLHSPQVVIADEPTSALDSITQSEVLDLLRSTSQERGTALLFVSHDLLSVMRLCHSICMLSGGQLTEALPLASLETAKNADLQTLLQSLPVPPSVLLAHLGRNAVSPQLHL